MYHLKLRVNLELILLVLHVKYKSTGPTALVFQSEAFKTNMNIHNKSLKFQALTIYKD